MKRAVVFAALIASCTGQATNLLESQDADSGVDPGVDVGAPNNAGDSGPDFDIGGHEDADAGLDCGPPMPLFCFRQCGGDSYAPPFCTESGWACPEGSHPMTEFETYCVGMLDGVCASNHSCESGFVCATTGRCAYACPENSGYPQCATNGCCESIVGGLCSSLAANFVGCPWDAIPLEQCHACSSPDAG